MAKHKLIKKLNRKIRWITMLTVCFTISLFSLLFYDAKYNKDKVAFAEPTVLLSGNLTNTISYVLYSDNRFVLSGTGASVNNQIPWTAQRDKIYYVEVEEGITGLPEKCFYGARVQTVKLPESLTEIREWCFYASYLKTIRIPSSVTHVGNKAFGYEDPIFSKLVTVVWPDCVTYYPKDGSQSIFYNANTLQNIVLKESSYSTEFSKVNKQKAGLNYYCMSYELPNSGNFTGSVIKPVISYKLFQRNVEQKSGTLVEGTDYTITETTGDLTSPGSHRIIIQATIDSAEFEYLINYDINKCPIDSCTINVGNTDYTGVAATPTVSVSMGDYTFTNGTDYEVSCTSVNAGSASVTITPKGSKLSGNAVTKNFTINPAAITVDPSGFDAITKEYDGTSAAKWNENTSKTGTIAGNNNEILNYTYTGIYSNIDVGTSNVTYSLTSFDFVTGGNASKSNYILNFDEDKLVNGKANTITAKSVLVDASVYDAVSKTYDGNKTVYFNSTDTVLSKSLSVISGETINFKVKGEYESADCGDGNKTVTYSLDTTDTITVEGTNTNKDNYSLTIDVESDHNKTTNNTILKKTIAESDFEEIDLSDETYSGSQINKTITPKTLASGDYSVSYSDDVNAGDCVITVSGAGENCTGSFTKTFKILQKELSASDFEFTGSKVLKNIVDETSYDNTVPSDELAKIVVSYKNDANVILTFTSALFDGITPSDNPKKYGDCPIILSGLGVNNTNYKLGDAFTSFTLDSTNGAIINASQPVFDDTFVTIISGTYKKDDNIDIVLSFNKPLTMSGLTPELNFWSDDNASGTLGTLTSGKYLASATFKEVNSNKVTFTYKVKDGDSIPNGFTFKVKSITNSNSLKDENGVSINVTENSKQISGVTIISPEGLITDLINLIEGNKTKDEKKEIILNILKNNDKTDQIFDTIDDSDLISNIGSGSSNNDKKAFVSDFVSGVDLKSANKKNELLNNMRLGIGLYETQGDIQTIVSAVSPTKADLDAAMIRYQSLSKEQKENFDTTIKTNLDTAYYGMFTPDYKYKDDEVEIYGIASKTSAGDNPVKINVRRMLTLDEINNLYTLLPAGSDEKILTCYDIELTNKDGDEVSPTGQLLVRVELASEVYDKIENVYHIKDDGTLETMSPMKVLIQLLGGKTEVFINATSFSSYFITTKENMIKTNIDPSSTPGTVSPSGITSNPGSSQTFTFTKSGDTNRVDITIMKFDDALGTYVNLQDVDPINLYEKMSYTINPVSGDMIVVFKFSHDDNYKSPTGGGGGGGGGSGTSKEEKPPVVEPPHTQQVVSNPYIRGFEDGTFKPEDNLNRSSFATIIESLLFDEDKLSEEEIEELFKPYSDLNPNGWYAQAIAFCIKNKIMIGYDDGSFKPYSNITRAEASKVIALSFEVKDKGIANKFERELKGEWFESYMDILVRAGIINGFNDGTLKGNNNIRRCEIVIMLNRVLEREINEEELSKLDNPFADLKKTDWYYFDILDSAVSHIYEKEIAQTEEKTNKTN